MYYTPAQAVRQLLHRQKHERARLYAYKCQLCEGFHLTKVKPPPEHIVSIRSCTYRKERP